MAYVVYVLYLVLSLAQIRGQTYGQRVDECSRLQLSVAVMQNKLITIENNLRTTDIRLESKTVIFDKEIRELKLRLTSHITKHAIKLADLQKKQSKIRVAFSVARSANLNPSGRNEPLMIPYDKIWVNDGNGFNNYSSIFTAPIAGVYAFNYHVRTKIATNVYIYLVQNKEQRCSAYTNPSQGMKAHIGNSIILRLALGDQVWMVLGPQSHIDDNSEHHTTFNGHLLYVD